LDFDRNVPATGGMDAVFIVPLVGAPVAVRRAGGCRRGTGRDGEGVARFHRPGTAADHLTPAGPSWRWVASRSPSGSAGCGSSPRTGRRR
jgi:hypothetical protein